ncbi:hypothetical protein H312_03068 [Anncaliia algerae PRA339]|uniref:Uncharacterized protein n=1 Tax=Anncaliia algerae PRA339 TaxID=1288291 RepID=A0A059EXV1_9MICR|nr:hypothetical protein H312_03068 [Anncaliia algerae PRA339]
MEDINLFKIVLYCIVCLTMYCSDKSVGIDQNCLLNKKILSDKETMKIYQ